MSEKSQKQKRIVLTLIAIIAIAIIGVAYTQSKASGWIWKETTNPTPTPTQAANPTIAPTQPPGGNGSTPVPTATATPWNPTGPTPTATPTSTPQQPTAQVWQSLYVTDTSGSYWVSPATPISAMNILAYNNQASKWNTVSAISNNVYMNINLHGISVASWSLTAVETITVNHQTSSGGLGASYGTVAAPTTISGGGGILYSSTNTWVTGSNLPAASLETIIQNIIQSQTSGYIYLVVQLSNVQITLHLQNGQTWTLSQASASTPENTLAWQIAISN
jgi:hypothetical protein